MMELVWDPGSWEDYLYWQKTDKKILIRINELIKDAIRSPFKGIGKPEPLKGNLSGCWSRRINDEHRLVYAVREKRLFILQCRFHYDK
jgi:toxin YoeB